MNARTLVIGIDIGGTKVLGGVVDPTEPCSAASAGRPRPQHDVRRPSRTRSSRWCESLPPAVRRRGGRDRGRRVRRRARTVVLFSPHLAWRDEPLRARRWPTGSGVPVVVDNDANTAALAECRFGAGRGHRLRALHDPRHRHRRRARHRQPGVPRRERDGGGVRAHAGRPGRAPVRVRQPRLLGAVRLRQRAGPRGPGAGRRQVAGGVRAAPRPLTATRPAHRPAGHRGGAGRRPGWPIELLAEVGRLARRRAGRDARGVRPELRRHRRRGVRRG